LFPVRLRILDEQILSWRAIRQIGAFDPLTAREALSSRTTSSPSTRHERNQAGQWPGGRANTSWLLGFRSRRRRCDVPGRSVVPKVKLGHERELLAIARNVEQRQLATFVLHLFRQPAEFHGSLAPVPGIVEMRYIKHTCTHITSGTAHTRPRLLGSSRYGRC